MKMKSKFGVLGLAIVFCAASGVLPPKEKDANAAGSDIAKITVTTAGFATLSKALREAGLVETLAERGPYTVFAPTDEAFDKLPPGVLEGLLKDKAKLREVLLCHVVPGAIRAEDAARLGESATAGGRTIRIVSAPGGITVNGAKVLRGDIEASNGLIHIIDTVIVPEDL